MRTKYTNEDIEFLRIYYPIGDWDTIFARFPHLTKDQIYHVCHKRGISANYYTRDKRLKSDAYERMAKNRTKWTNYEIEILKNNYTNMPITELMKLLPNRTYNAIVAKAKKLSLTSYVRQQQLYSDADIEFIKNNWKLTSDEEIALSLNRTRRAIKAMRNELGLFRQDMERCHYEDLVKFFRGRIYQWKKCSMENCNYQCVLTGSKNFAIHHIISFNIIVRNFLSIYDITLKDNFDDYSVDELDELSKMFVEYHDTYPLGVCVDKSLHIEFHKMYGDINDEQQWNAFVQKFNEGKILH
jgi:hypothetical protein